MGGHNRHNVHEDVLVAGLALLHGPVGGGEAGDVGKELAILVDGRGGVLVDGAGRELEDLGVADLLDVPLAKGCCVSGSMDSIVWGWEMWASTSAAPVSLTWMLTGLESIDLFSTESRWTQRSPQGLVTMVEMK